MTACTLCGRDPVQGDSSINGHAVCHPDVASRARDLSCLEVIGYVAVEHHPYGRRPPIPIPTVQRLRARDWIAQHIT